MMSIFVRFPFERGCKGITVGNDGVRGRYLRLAIASIYFAGNNDFLIYKNGKELSENGYVYPNETVHISFTLPGGKGGFGSMLRAIGAQIEKTTNREACRDLSGRRLRDINEEQRLKKWIAQKAEREAEKIRRRKARIERLKSRPKHNFVDFEYEKQISNLPERVDDALSAGLQNAKRPLEINEPSTSSNKKKHLWLDEEISGTSSDSDLDKSSTNEQMDDSLDEGACCSASLNQSENLVSLTSDGECDLIKSIENDSSSSTSSSDVPKTILQSIIHHHSGRQSECIDQIPSSPENFTKVDSGLQNVSIEKSCESNQPHTVEKNLNMQDENIPINLDEVSSSAELEAFGLQRLKCALMERGLKCGGNIKDRAQRLWTVRSLNPENYPKNLLAKPKK